MRRAPIALLLSITVVVVLLETTAVAPGAGGVGSLLAGAPTISRPVAWTNVSSNLSSAPPQMNGPEMTYDGADGSVLLFGGYLINGGGSSMATWEYNASGWHSVSTASPPPGKNLGALAYDRATRSAILFGGNQNGVSNTAGLYAFSGGNWAAMSKASVPAGRTATMMAYDQGSGSMLMFGGCGPANRAGTCVPYGDTWSFSAGNWTKLNLTISPSARAEGAMSYDSTLRAIVLFGGCTTLKNNVCLRVANDTWEFKSGGWTNITGGVAPSPRYGPQMVQDPRLGGPVMFGGATLNGTLLGGTWVLHNTHWVQLHPTHSPTPRWRFGLAYDPNLSEVLLFSGYAGPHAGYTNDTWVLA